MSEAPKRIWDNCKLIGELKKSDSTKLKVELVARDGVKYINIRDWYITKRTQEWKPGLAGLAIPIVLPIDGEVTEVMTDLQKLIVQALSEAEEFPIEDEANAVYSKPKAKK